MRAPSAALDAPHSRNSRNLRLMILLLPLRQNLGVPFLIHPDVVRRAAFSICRLKGHRPAIRSKLDSPGRDVDLSVSGPFGCLVDRVKIHALERKRALVAAL